MAGKKAGYINTIYTYIQEESRSYINLAYVVFKVLSQAGDKAPELMNNFFVEFEKSGYYFNDSKEKKTDSEVFITREEKKELVRKLGGYTAYYLNNEINQNHSASTFYKNMWNFIIEDKIFSDDKERATALYIFLINPRIPYYKIKVPKKVSQETFEEKMDQTLSIRQKARFIIYTPFEKRTQEAMALLDLFDGLEDKEERAVLLASIIRNVESRTK